MEHSDYTTLKASLEQATRQWEDALEWLQAGSDITHSQASLEAAERQAFRAWMSAHNALAEYLLCPVCRRGTLAIERNSDRPAPRKWECYCDNCMDLGSIIGTGATDSEALADYDRLWVDRYDTYGPLQLHRVEHDY